MAKKNFLPGILAILLICTVLLAGCEFGGENNSEPDPGDGITALEPVGPLPAALVEADPMPGSELGVNAEITLYFNQPMNKPSVEAAVQISPAVSGDFTWLDDSTVSFSPASSWEPDTDLVLTITSAAKSADDQPLQQATSLAYHVADFLLLVQGLPVADIEDVDPTAAIVAAFNYPVVPLGASPESLFPAFTLVPEAEGKGEWINTSTYIFYPQPGLFGGQAYSVQLDPTLKSVDGTPLKDSTSWAFTTAQPALISFSPAPGEMQVRLDEEIKLVFNQPMDTESLEKGFVLRRGDGSAVSGSFEWNDSETRMLFIPDELYTRDQRYSVYIPSNASSKGGSVLTANIGNFSFFAARELFVTTTEPGSGGLKEYRRSVVINFNSPLEDDGNLEAYVSVDPVVDVRVSSDKNSLYVSGNFQPEEQYTVSVLPGISDIWGDPLDQTFQLNFRGAPLNPDFRVSIFSGAGVMFVNPENPGIAAQVVNIDQVEVLTANLPLQEFIYLDGEADYETKQNYQPAQPAIRTQNLDILPNRNQQVGVGLSASGDLPTGLYWVKLTPDPAPKYSQPQNFFAVVSHIHLVYKVGSSDALVWAMDTRSGEPAANAPVALYSEAGILLASGVTDHQGMFYSKISIEGDLYGSSYAVLNSPGDDQFSLATSVWDWGISAWDFGFRADFSPSEFEYYIYTDRPIYKPGDMVQYRVIARSAFFGRYQLPGEESILLSVRDHNNAELSSYTLPLSEHGTSSGAYYLSDGAQPGYYELRVGEPGNFSYLTFQVAEYRKPEIDLQVSFGQQEILAGEALDAEVLAEYFFDAPVSDVDTQWDLYIDDDYFYLPGYRVGPLRERSYNPWSSFYTGGLGIWSAGGEETTDGQGGFAVNLTSEATSRIQEYSFEVTVADESGMPVSSRASAIVHPAPIYIGLRSDLWVGQVDTEMGFDLKVVDWEKQNAGEQSVKAVFGKVSWERSGPDQFGSFSYEKVVTLISEGQLDTNGQGEARLTFIPETPGVYQLEVSSGEAITQMLIWVGGPGQTAWPSLEENQLTLIPDAETYQVGDTASIFIPNPFVGDAQVLVTVERGDILDQEVITISGSGLTYSLAIEELSVPNVYFTVAMIGETAKGTLDYYYGLTNFDVAVEKQVLNVVVAGDPERAYPGSPIEFTIQVTDNTGAPVEGEFSLSVVDEAVLALADPYEDPILEFFYGRQPLGVRTGIS
ncbi:MAG: Ig-like domain-containing protein, partial [Chloroflexota bacterium]